MPVPATSAAPTLASNPSTFTDGLRDIAPVMLATIPFGTVFGALATKEGLSVEESLLMSGLVYAGASQFVALEFWANPLPFWTILLSVLAVNLRHVLYSAALGRKMVHWSPAARYLGFAFLVDPTFAVAELKGGPRLSAAYYFGLAVPLYANWLVMTALGAIFGALIRRPEAFGLDFVVPAYFIYLIVSFRKRPNALPIVVAAGRGRSSLISRQGRHGHIAGGAFAGMGIAGLLVKEREEGA
jgi:4-azaleucine resistance transporter AzlC